MYIASVVFTYWCVSISMVYLNKVLMSNEGVSINAPLFVTWFQCIVTALICWLAGRCGARAQRKVAGYASVNTDEEGGKAVQQPQKPSFFFTIPYSGVFMCCCTACLPSECDFCMYDHFQ